MNFSVVDFFRFAPRMPQIAQILVSTLNIFPGCYLIILFVFISFIFVYLLMHSFIYLFRVSYSFPLLFCLCLFASDLLVEGAN